MPIPTRGSRTPVLVSVWEQWGRLLRATASSDSTPPLSSEATSRRHSSLGFSSTGLTLPSESNPPFLDRVAPTSTSSTSLAVDQVFLFMNPSYLSNQHTHVGIYDNKHKFETLQK